MVTIRNIKKLCILLGAGTMCVCVCVPEIFKTDCRHFPIGLCNGNAVFSVRWKLSFLCSKCRACVNRSGVCFVVDLFCSDAELGRLLPPALQVGVRMAV